MKIKESISVFFPAYGDETTIGKLVEDAISTLKKVTNDYEVIVIDDFSPDKSGQIADKLARKYPQVRVIHHKKNRGYGGALKSGFANAKKDLIFYTDGDAQYDVKELTKLIPLIKNSDVVNGYKIKRSDKPYRIILGGAYNIFVRVFFALKIRDVDCDFRLFRRRVLEKIKLESNSGVICVEMMKKVQNAGFNVVETPVHHYSRSGGSSQFFKVGRLLRVFRGLAKQWWLLMFIRKLKDL